MKKVFLFIFFAFNCLLYKHTSAQIADPVHWSFRTNKLSDCEFELIIQAKLDGNWHLYGQKSYGDDGPYPTTFHYTPNSNYKLMGKTTEETLIKKFEPIFNQELNYFEHAALFKQKVEIKSDQVVEIKGDFEFMVCNDATCMPPSTVPFSFKIKGSSDCIHTSNPSKSSSRGFIPGFFGLLLVLLFNLTFPMIPLIAAFFTKGKTPNENIGSNTEKCSRIIVVIYTVSALIALLSFGSPALNFSSMTSWFDILFFIVFFAFGISFLGAFEIIPSRFKSNRYPHHNNPAGWFNSSKIILGLLELAIALIFASNADLALHTNIISREVFISLWIVIFGIMGMYLLGKIKFSHDIDLKYVPVPRLFIAILVFSFTLYLIPGLWGAPLKLVTHFLPPDFYSESISRK